MKRVVLSLVLLLGACSTPDEKADERVDEGGRAATREAAPRTETAKPDRATLGDPPPYSSSVRPIGPALRDRMRFSHRPGCPLELADLRYLRMRFIGFDGRTHLGELVVRKDLADAVTGAFEQLYAARWPIRRMRLVDDYLGDDDRSMAANNTSGYNCRRVAGSRAWSAHAFGAAIDLNPVQNPYVRGGSVSPPAGRSYSLIDRSAPARTPAGAVKAGDVVIRAFAGIGWDWGGFWSSSQDYQHFSASGG